MSEADSKPSWISIVMADDDEDDQLLAREALAENRLANPIQFVSDGEQLLAYLRNQPPFEDREACPRPGLILLDLNMPRMDGREALREIKADPDLRSIPVVVLTTSKAEEDILRTYDLGANSYITKPVSFDGLIEVMGSLGGYWLGIVQLPTNGPSS
jgi:CheY-like chemotaxis protein